MEIGLERGDWEMLQRASDALTNFTRDEPLPLSNYYIARAQALRNFYQDQDRDRVIGNLQELKLQAEQVGLNNALPRIETALREAGD